MDLDQYLDNLLQKLGISNLKGSWEDAWIKSDGVTLYAPVFPCEQGKPTVVFIPGTSVYALCYIEFLHGLWEQGFNVVGFDPRGQGQSSGIRGDYTIMEHVADAGAAIEYSRDRFKGEVFVMGSSQGGIEAFYLAAKASPPADGYICHNIADLEDPDSVRLTRFGPKKERKQGRPLVRLLTRTAMSAMRAQAKLLPRLKVPIAAYLDLKSEPMRFFENAWNFILQDPLALTSITMRAAASLAGTPLPRPLEEIQGPMLVLHSSLDHIFPQDYILRLYEKLRCEKEMKIYPDLHHLITIEHVELILPDLVKWINERALRSEV